MVSFGGLVGLINLVKKSLDRLAGRPARRNAVGFPAVHRRLIHAKPNAEHRLALAELRAGFL